MYISRLSICCLLIGALVVESTSLTNKQHEKARNLIISAEEKIITGGRLSLSNNEEWADKTLKNAKNAEIAAGFINLATYAPALHFFNAKPLIEKSDVFKFIKAMPKGGNLHGHNSAMVSSEWILKNITYREGLYICTAKSNNAITVFTFKNPFGDCEDDIRLVSELRTESGNVAKFDNELEKLFNLYTPTPYTDYPDVNAVWTKFQGIFGVLGDCINFLPVFKDYHIQLLQELYDDNVMYVEFRSSLPSIYDESGKVYSTLETVLVLEQVVKAFKKSHPRFIGAKVIYAAERLVPAKTVAVRMNTFKQIYAAFPNFVIGFDLVGQEDLGNPLNNFIDELKELPKGAKFFFHAGDTNWYGASTDLNLIDAILLNTARIGHGHALVKHPVLWNAVKVREIPIEICPISSQVLNLVRDLRNHPAAFYVSENLPIVIGNDDAGFWNAKALSYDFYYAFMAFTPVNAGLKTLKQLALNSVKYSVLTKAESKLANERFNEDWNAFIRKVNLGKII